MDLTANFMLDLRRVPARLRSQLAFEWPQLPDIVLAVGCISLVIVCLGLFAVPGYHELRLRAKAAAVVGNAATVQLAAETYAATHEGDYATDPLDLLPYLPAKAAPANPYSDNKIDFAGVAGDLTYRSPSQGSDYIIQAFAMGSGGKPKLVATLTGRRPHGPGGLQGR